MSLIRDDDDDEEDEIGYYTPRERAEIQRAENKRCSQLLDRIADP